MKPSPRAIDRRFGAALCALCATAAIVLTSHKLQAQEQFNIGPRSLYGARTTDRQTDIPLVMRDALQNLATGTRLLATGPRIIGGQPAPAGAYPFMASIQVRGAPARAGHFCGGAFIGPHWVVTAAHCVDTSSAARIQVLGHTNVLDKGGTVHFVSRIVTHEKWDNLLHDNDIALLRLERPFTGRAVRLVAAEEAGRLTAPGTLAVVAGWGLTAEGGNVSNILRRVTVQIVSNKVCNGLGSYSGAITDQMLCAGFAEGGKDSCQGDSGGPLVVPGRAGGHVQVGVVSFGEGCARPNKYGVYANVAAFDRWVAGKTGIRMGAEPTDEIAADPAAPAATAARAAAPQREQARSSQRAPLRTPRTAQQSVSRPLGIGRRPPPVPPPRPPFRVGPLFELKGRP